MTLISQNKRIFNDNHDIHTDPLWMGPFREFHTDSVPQLGEGLETVQMGPFMEVHSGSVPPPRGIQAECPRPGDNT